MKEKWRDERGDTLIEVLASILVMALSILLLFGAVIASGRINKTAKDADDAYYEVLNEAEKQETKISDTTEDIVPKDGEGKQVKVNVKQQPESPATPVPDPESKDVEVSYYGGKGALSYKYD